MPDRMTLTVVAGFAMAIGLGALSSCTAVLPPAMYASPAAGAGDGAGATFAGDVVPMLRQHCAGCHGAGGGGADAVTMFDAGGEAQYANIKLRAGDMVAAIRNGRMPLGRPGTVPEAQVAKLSDWHAAGAPNNAPPAGQAPASPAAPDTPGTAGQEAEVLSLRAHVVPLLREHCQSCHVRGGVAPPAMFDTAGQPMVETLQAEIGAMIAAVEAGRMPKGRPGALSAAQLDMLKAWRQAGTPNN